MPVQAHQSVGELVVERPARSRVFEQFGIDYCCGGKRSLEDACTRKGLDAQGVIDELEHADRVQQDLDEGPDPSVMSLAELADHIERTHHNFLKTELGRIDQLTTKVAQAHGQRDPRLVELLGVYRAFREELMMHMHKEEQILFPLIRSMEGGERAAPAHCGSIQNPIRQMEAEHDDAGGALEAMRELTEGFTPPEDACNTYRAMLDALSHLERDMHAHVHKENNILFPRAVRMEAELNPEAR